MSCTEIIGICLLGLHSCVPSEQEVIIDQPTGKPITFSGRKNTIITRAGDTYEAYPNGTIYDLYACDVAARPNYWSGTDLVLDGNQGEEESGYITYTLTTGQLPYFNNRTLDFYGVTWGTPTDPVETPAANASTPPKYAIAVGANDSLPDLMHAYTADRTSSQGTIVLDFKHTTSKIRIEVGQQLVNDAERFSNVHVESIILKNTYQSGKLNLQTGLYEKDTPAAGSQRPFYSRGSGTKIAVGGTPHRFAREMLIFPREADDAQGLLEVEITLGKDADNNWRTVSCPLKYETEVSGVYENYSFKPNYEYILTLMLIDEDVKLVVFSPQVYEWMDVEDANAQSYLGRPVTFGGLMWMDRNLGAQSADCYNDWDNTRGYYYQYGRNVPYMLDESKWTDANSAAWTDIYTLDQDGNKIIGDLAYLSINSTHWGQDQLAFDPGGIPVSPVDGYTGYEYIYMAGIPAFRTYWDNVETQPCPKGWRLPTDMDVVKYLPDPRISGAIENMNATGIDIVNTIGSGKEDRVVGKLNGVLSVYLLKNKGSDDCYLIRIRRLNSIHGDIKQYFEFNRYPAEKDWDFTGADINNIENLYDWNAPTEQLIIPCVGFINPNINYPFEGDGKLTILRVQCPSNNTNSRAYYLRTDLYFGVYISHGRACGDQIRCVRDLNN